MNKKRIVILLILIVIVMILALFWTQSQTKQQEVSLPTPTPAQQPILPSPIVSDQPKYQVGVGGKTFPQTLPVYIISSKPQIRTIASIYSLSVGIAGDPQVIPSTGGTIYLWQNNNGSVTASEATSTISYTSIVPLGGTINAPTATFNTAALKTIAPLHISDPPFELTPSSPQYFIPAGGDANETNRPSLATSIQINYQYTIGGVPVYTGTSTGPSVFVRMNAKAEVLTFTAYVPPSVKASEENAPLLSYVEAAQKLQGGGGRLTDLVSGQSGDQPYLFDAPPQISDITDVTLAYYYSSGQNRLIPVYAFQGTGQINQKPVNTTTLVSAVK